MKAIRILFALTLSLCILFGACVAHAQSFSAWQIDNCDEYVNLREKPDSKSRALDQVNIGEVVMASPYNDAFSYCCYNGQYGYIRNEYLSYNIQPWSDGTFYVTNCKQSISLRKMPMKSAEALMQIPLDAELDAIYYHDGGGTSGKFVYVKYNGQYGFVLWDYLAVSDSYQNSSPMTAQQIANCEEYVNLRENADSKSRSLSKVYIGEVVMATPYDDTYSYCCYNGQFGFIMTKYLSSSIQPWSEGSFYVTNCNEYISLRRMPLKSSDQLTRIPLGATLDEVYYHDGGDTSDSFVYVKYNGQYGFVLWDYLAAEWHEGWQ